MKRICKGCGKEFDRSESELANYCSRRCYRYFYYRKNRKEILAKEKLYYEFNKESVRRREHKYEAIAYQKSVETMDIPDIYYSQEKEDWR